MRHCCGMRCLAPTRLDCLLMKKTHHLSQEAYEKALAASAKRPRNPWAVEAVEYDVVKKSILMLFPGGFGLALPVSLIDEFRSVKPADLLKVYLSPSGETLCIDEADVHISTHGLIRDVFNHLPKELLGRQFGAMAGVRSSKAKKAISAVNGKKGNPIKPLVATAP